MHFRVLANGEPRPVQLIFGREADLKVLSRWRLPQSLRGYEPAKDALQYARLSTKRWRFHKSSSQVVESFDELRVAASNKAQVECVFLLVAQATWAKPSPILGFALCHVTWCGHIFLDFLSVHPRVTGNQKPVIRGVGGGILFGLCALASESNIPVIWGETTVTSVAFYRKILRNSSMLDLLKISGSRFRSCVAQFERIRLFAT